MKNIGIIGCGWLGKKIAKRLEINYNVRSTTRTIANFELLEELKFNPTLVDFSSTLSSIKKWETLEHFDAIIVAVPFTVRFSSEEEVKVKFENLSRFISGYKKQLIYSSSTGVYPTAVGSYIESDLKPTDSYIENLFVSVFPQTTILRFGGLMGADKKFMNYKVANLEDAVNHIHCDDICNLIELLLKNNVQQEVYNVVAPEHPSKNAVINFQKGLPFEDVVTGKVRVISPQKLIDDLNFEFKYPDPKRFHL